MEFKTGAKESNRASSSVSQEHLLFLLERGNWRSHISSCCRANERITAVLRVAF